MLACLFWIWCTFYFGACYYMDWFAAKYEEKLSKLEEFEKKVKATSPAPTPEKSKPQKNKD